MSRDPAMTKKVLAGGIGRILDDTARTEISKRAIEVYGNCDWDVINEALQDWENAGLLRILKKPETAGDEEIVVKMLDYIERTGPKPTWINWDE